MWGIFMVYRLRLGRSLVAVYLERILCSLLDILRRPFGLPGRTGELRIHVQELPLEIFRSAAEPRIVLPELARHFGQALRPDDNKNDGEQDKPLAGTRIAEDKRKRHRKRRTYFAW